MTDQQLSEIYSSTNLMVCHGCGGAVGEIKGAEKKENVIYSMQGERNTVRLSLLLGYFLIREISVLQGLSLFCCVRI